MFQDILIPLDGSSRAEKVLPVAARLAHITDGTVSLLQAVLATERVYGLGGRDSATRCP